jgi:hypothetical protein
MSTMKDKLANSVRQAKSAALPATAKPGAAKRTPPARATAAPPKAKAPAVPAASRAHAEAQNPAPNTRELFPRRVWPD